MLLWLWWIVGTIGGDTEEVEAAYLWEAGLEGDSGGDWSWFWWKCKGAWLAYDFGEDTGVVYCEVEGAKAGSCWDGAAYCCCLCEEGWT